MFKRLTFATLCFALAACHVDGAGEASEGQSGQATEAISVSELVATSENGTALLDLRSTSDRYWFEQDMEYAAVDVICPSGRAMNMASWLPELESELGTQLTDREDGFEMYSSKKIGSHQKAPPCTDPCYLHLEPDHTWVCFCAD